MARQKTIDDYYRELETVIQKEISGRTDEDILGLDVTEYTEYLFSTYALIPIELDESREQTVQMKRERRQIRDHFGETASHEVIIALIELPLIIHSKLAKVMELWPNNQNFSPPRTELRGDVLIMNVELPFLYGLGDGPPSGAGEISSAIHNLQFWLHSRNSDIERLNPQLRVFVEQAIQTRKGWIVQTTSDFGALIQQVSFPLKIKSLQNMVPIAIPIRSELHPVIKPPTPKRPEEITLRRTDVLAVIELIKRYGQSLEATPNAVAVHDEEDIRSLFLAHLNGLVEGAATAETFNKGGKTDIYLQLPKGGILVAECKVWRGAQAYGEAISQLFGYLTWRQCYGIIITFVRNREFTNTIIHAENAISLHTTYRTSVPRLALNHLQSQHTFPDDPQRSVEVHHLLFHFSPG